MIPPGYDPEFYRSPDPSTRRLTKQNASLVQVSMYHCIVIYIKQRSEAWMVKIEW